MYRNLNPKWRYPLALLAVYSVIWLALAIDPVYRDDWLLENVLIFLSVPLLVFTAKRLRFSDFTYTCLFAFFVLHSIGSHYTYALVPYDDWFRALTGGSLNELLGFERNHFDRLVHFLYGVLVTPAAVELFAHYGRYPRAWAVLFPFLFMASHSGIYEIIEWGAAIVFGGDLGQAYLGTQGDIWDGQRDMALAMLGSAITIGAMALLGRLPVKVGTAQAPAGPARGDWR
jgi:putative membrane protein